MGIKNNKFNLRLTLIKISNHFWRTAINFKKTQTEI